MVAFQITKLSGSALKEIATEKSFRNTRRREFTETMKWAELATSCNGRLRANPFARDTATSKQSGPTVVAINAV